VVARNPYRPGVGKDPPYLADREAHLKRFGKYLAGFPENRRNLRVTGLRGVGKTVLLKEYRKLARESDWVVIRRDFAKRFLDEAAFAVAIAEDMQKAVEELSKTEKLRRLATDALDAIGGITVDVGGITAQMRIPGIERQRILEDRMRDALLKVGMLAAKSERGVAFLCDEAHVVYDRDKEGHYPLSALLASFVECQDYDDVDLPVMLVVCGLPPLVTNLQAARSHSERLFKAEEIENLDLGDANGEPSVAAVALTKPSEETPISFDPGTAQRVAQDVSGYPYFIQWYGEALWDAAEESGVLEVNDLLYEAAKEAIQDGLDVEFFEGRYNETRRNEQGTLRVAASLGEESFRTADILEQYPASKKSGIQMSLNRLIGDNLIYRIRYGEYRYTAPLFGDFLRRKHPRQDGDTRRGKLDFG
jgi:hypothetical protein